MDYVDAQTKLRAITPGSPEYDSWNGRGANLRFTGTPSRIIPVSTVEALTGALQQTLMENLHLSVRGGGHCLENFVCDPAVKVVIDISGMKGSRYDPEMNAIEVMAGTTLGEMHETLFNNWGIVLPVGEYPAIGIGGHIQGGAFGFLCRQHGLGVDYLYAVELLWVNKKREVEKIIATCETSDPNRELWWAHTGGGAGNFGIVTRYWFRAVDATGNDPATLLPKAPVHIDTVEIDWDWNALSKENFTALVKNFGAWSEQNAAPGATASAIFATLHLTNKAAGKLMLKCVLTDATHADAVLHDLLNSVCEGVDIPYKLMRKKLSWLDFALDPFPDFFGEEKSAFKFKDAFLHTPFTAEQVNVAYSYLTECPDTPGVFIGLATYGCQVNAISPDVTATAQRSAILTTSCTAGWTEPADEPKYLAWARAAYGDLYANTGGAPVPNGKTGGCIIAHPDNDLADPLWNKSGLPWYTFYYQHHYPMLQKIKAAWDPCNIFHHALSVQPEAPHGA